MDQSIVATWHDGLSARAHTVLVVLCPQGETLSFYPLAPAEEGQPPVSIPTAPCMQWKLNDAVLVSGTPGDLPVRFSLKEDTGQRLVIPHAEAAATFLEWYQPGKAKHQRSKMQRWVVATLGLWALGVFLYLGSPLLTQLIVAAIPASWEQRMGESTLQQFLEVHSLVEGEKNYVVNPPGPATAGAAPCRSKRQPRLYLYHYGAALPHGKRPGLAGGATAYFFRPHSRRQNPGRTGWRGGP